MQKRLARVFGASAATYSRPGVAGLLLCVALACGLGTTRTTSAPDILLITLDTTRLDRLGVYGYTGETTPNLDRFAEEAEVYTQAISTSSWTYPAHVSLFTGKLPSSHGARYDPQGSLRLTSVLDGPERWQQFRVRRISEEERTLAALLREAGYRTGAVVAGPWLKRIMGLDAGFDVYDDAGIGSMNGRIATDVTDRGLEFVSETADQPFFLFLNYFDPHGPWKAPAEFVRDTSRAEAAAPQSDRDRLYDAEVRFMDHHLGRLFAGLRDLGRFDDTWIIITADHGELLGEHGIVGHGNTLHEELIRIPLIVRAPAGEGPTGPNDSPAQQVDVFATILERLGIELPEGVQGEALGSVERPIISEVFQLEFMQSAFRKSSDIWRGSLKSLRGDRGKFVWSELGLHRLFDLDADPGEARDLLEADPAAGDALQAQLEQYLGGLPEPLPDLSEEGSVDAATEEALRKLGYLE